MTDRTLTLVNDDGTEILCDILFTYHYEKTNKDYVVFQVRETEEVSAAIYYPEDNGAGRLDQITTDDEWSMLEGLLNDYANQDMDDEECSCGGSCDSCGGGCGGECGR